MQKEFSMTIKAKSEGLNLEAFAKIEKGEEKDDKKAIIKEKGDEAKHEKTPLHHRNKTEEQKLSF